MGLILDSSVLVSRERQGKNARQALESVAQDIGDVEIAISVITLIELAHGAARANTPERKNHRETFIQELVAAVPVHSITASIALRAGFVDGENRARGIQIPLPDLLIAVTALELGYDVGTANVRDFERVAGLRIVRM